MLYMKNDGDRKNRNGIQGNCFFLFFHVEDSLHIDLLFSEISSLSTLDADDDPPLGEVILIGLVLL